MTLSVWGFEPWILTGLTGLVLLVVLGAITGQRTATLMSRSDPQWSLDVKPRRALEDPFIKASLPLRTGIALGVVFVMVTKPGTAGSLATMGVAVAISLTASVWLRRRTRVRSRSGALARTADQPQ